MEEISISKRSRTGAPNQTVLFLSPPIAGGHGPNSNLYQEVTAAAIGCQGYGHGPPHPWFSYAATARSATVDSKTLRHRVRAASGPHHIGGVLTSAKYGPLFRMSFLPPRPAPPERGARRVHSSPSRLRLHDFHDIIPLCQPSAASLFSRIGERRRHSRHPRAMTLEYHRPIVPR